MFPPTPTALPPAAAPLVNLQPTNWRIWAFTDEAIMIWNTAPNSATQVIQIAIIVVIIIAAVALMIRYVEAMTHDGEGL